MTNSEAVTHPSQPNYLAIFSGSTQGVADDSCPQSFSLPNLASELISQNLTFAGYAENFPTSSVTDCTDNGYARKHVPWIDFSNIPTSDAFNDSGPLQSITANVSFITPNLCDDMHDCAVSNGDTWLSQNLPPIIQWDQANHGLLILTWDESDADPNNHIPTILVGPTVKVGQYAQSITHYDVLRTIETVFNLPPLGSSATATGIQGVLQ
jgi:hypothetical protein